MAAQLSPADVTEVVGDPHAGKIAAIIASGATRRDLEDAHRLVQTRPAGVPLGLVAQVYRILAADDELWGVGIDE